MIKYTGFIACFILGFIFQVNAQLDSGLIVDFNFDNTLVDASASGISMVNNGSLYGADRNGDSNKAINFNSSGFISAADSSAKVSFPITVSYWMKLNSMSDVNVFFKTDNQVNNHSGIWMNNLSTGGLTLSFGGDKGAANSSNARYFTTDPSDKKLITGTWHHVVGIIRSYNDMEIYIDCQKVSGTYGGTGDTTVKYSNNGDFRIGGTSSYTGQDLNINGSMDDFKMWDRVLSKKEIEFTCGLISDMDLIADFKFDSTLVDDSPSGIGMTNKGSVYGVGRNGTENTAIDFNKTGHITAADSSTKVSFPVSVSYWVKLNSVSDVNTFFKTDNQMNNHSGVWMNNLSTGSLTLSFGGGKGMANSTNARYFTTNLSDKKLITGTWHHVVGIIRSYNDMEIYIDCQKVSGTYGGTGDTTVKYSSNGDFRIGGVTSYTGQDLNIDGSMDEFKMWSRVLSKTDIETSCGAPIVTPLTDLSISVNSGRNRPGFTIPHYLYVQSLGQDTLVTSVTYQLDDGLTYIQGGSETAPSNVNGNTVRWDSIVVAPGSSRRLRLYAILSRSTLLGSKLNCKAYLTQETADLHITNDTSLYEPTVTGSYDPNDKAVTYIGGNLNDNVHDTASFEYTIRFQNTGTDTAFTVRITDAISANMDITSISMLDASDNYEMVVAGDTVTWTFSNILLPDSNINEPASHGFLRFRINQKTNNTKGTEIKNKAFIYFDFNSAIITNEVVTIVDNDFANVTSTKIAYTSNVVCYPNPNTGAFTISSESIINNVTIYDQAGRLVKAINSSNVQNSIDIQLEKSGVYFVHVQSGNDTQILKAVVVK
jgi:uncharacterized repeat protein (TIGR01451 family)